MFHRHRIRQITHAALTVFLLTTMSGCADSKGGTPVNAQTPGTIDGAATPAPPRAGTTPVAVAPVDSIMSMEVMVARFQADLPAVTSFGDGAAASIDELIARFVEAVEDSSSDDLRRLLLNAAEFAHLYFPSSIYARPPYAQPPAVNWLLLEQNSLKGEARLLRYLGGRSLDARGYECAGEPSIEGANRLYDRCTLRIGGADGRVTDMRLFGSVIERDGRFKLMSLANRL